MDPKKPMPQSRTDPRKDEREQPDRNAAPAPIEREHETQAGALEEDEKREREGH